MPRKKKDTNTKETTVTTTDASTVEKEVDSAAQASAPKSSTRAAKKTAELIQETYFEFDGIQIMAEDIVAKIKEAYKAEGHRIGSIKSLKTYINPHERKAYYVINGKAEDRFIEF